jgi:hypothetical protein
MRWGNVLSGILTELEKTGEDLVFTDFRSVKKDEFKGDQSNDVLMYDDIMGSRKEVKVNMVGIVRSMHKNINKEISRSLTQGLKDVDIIKIALDSPYDKNMIDLYFVYSDRIDPLKIFKLKSVVLIQNATKKVSLSNKFLAVPTT